jgi:hypothetical protein
MPRIKGRKQIKVVREQELRILFGHKREEISESSS